MGLCSQEGGWAEPSPVPAPAGHSAGLAGQGAWLCPPGPESRWDSSGGALAAGMAGENPTVGLVFAVQPLVGVSGFSCSHTPLQCCLVSREAGMCGVPQGCCLWSEGCPELCPLQEQPERGV